MNTTNLESIRDIFKEDKQSIIKKYNANGAGIGKERKFYVIVVYMNTPIPKTLDNETWKGIPIKFENIGTVKPL